MRTLLSLLFGATLAIAAPTQEEEGNPDALGVQWNQKGIDALDRGDADAAVEAFHRALQFRPKDEVIRKNLGVAYFQRGQEELERKVWDRAISSFRLASEIDESTSRYPLFVGYAIHLSGNSTDAISPLLRVVTRFPQEIDAYRLLGEIYYGEADYPAAVDILERGLAALEKLPAPSGDETAVKKEKNSRSEKRKTLETLLDKAKKDRSIEKNYTPDSSNHFDFRYDGTKQSDLARNATALARDLEDAYGIVGEHFGVYPKKRIQVIFYDREGFAQTTSADQWVGGLFDGKIRIPVKDYSREKQRIRQVIFHEYTHAVIFTIAPNCPTWLNEGLAQIEEGLNVKDAEFRLKQIQDQWLKLDEFRGPFLGLGGEKAPIAYDMAFSFTKMLQDRYGYYPIASYLKRLGDGKEKEEAIVQDLFGRSLEELFNRWKEQLES